MPIHPFILDQADINPESIRNILIVCSGNICRSPMADGYLQKRLDEIRNKNIRVMSVGTLGLFNQEASEHAQTVAKNHGFDLTLHRSFPAESSIIMEADLIFVMEQQHIAFLQSIAPEKSNRFFLLGAMIDNNQENEIDDPIKGSLEDYEIAFEKIRASIDALVSWLSKSA